MPMITVKNHDASLLWCHCLFDCQFVGIGCLVVVGLIYVLKNDRVPVYVKNIVQNAEMLFEVVNMVRIAFAAQALKWQL